MKSEREKQISYINAYIWNLGGFPGDSVVKNLPASAGDAGGKIPWRRKWQPEPVFLPGESNGWWSLVGYNELNTTEHARMA